MIHTDLRKHAREFLNYLSRHRYERTDDGAIYFPQAHAFAAGEYVHSSNGGEEVTDPNLLPTAALNHMLSVTLGAGTQAPAWYLALFGGAYTPVAGLDAATFASAAAEITSNSEGYTSATRPVWTPAAASAGAIDNVASKAAFTIATATSITIRGAALLSNATKGGTAGTLISATRFSADRVQYAADVFSLGYRVRLTPA